MSDTIHLAIPIQKNPPKFEVLFNNLQHKIWFVLRIISYLSTSKIKDLPLSAVHDC
jgi:hypothetical protein